MSEGFTSRFTDEEMAAIRKSLRDEKRFGETFLARLKRVARRIPFTEDLLAAWYLHARSGDAAPRPHDAAGGARLFRAAARRACPTSCPCSASPTMRR